MVTMSHRMILLSGWSVLLLGVLLQLGVKDHYHPLAILFYALPKPCLIAWALLLAICSRRHRRWRFAAVAVVVLLSCWWLGSSFSLGKPARSEKVGDVDAEVTILYWNLCRPHGVDAHAVELVRKLQPHVAAFVEPGKEAGLHLASYEAQLPGYKAAWMPRGILWLSRVPSRYRLRGKLDEIGAFARFDVDGRGPTFPVVVVDVHPNLLRSRQRQLQEALEHTRGSPDALLVGDFNTPLESIHFEPYRALFTNALDTAGDGFRETWPIGLPLLSLDQAWIGKDWDLLEARKLWHLRGSDHAAIWLRLKRH